MITKPIHTAKINGNPVRFFKTPLNDGKPDFPWHSMHDLMVACALPLSMVEHFMRGAKQDHADMHRTIATADGVVTIAPHCCAQGLLGAMVHVGRITSNAEREYTKAVTEAGELLPYSQTIDGVIAAFHRWNDTAKGKGAAS
ncbi:MAG: hypothetical protein WCF85_21775 [Rhodospirillaceae bacterium]